MANQDLKLKLPALNPLAATFEPNVKNSVGNGVTNGVMEPLEKATTPGDAPVTQSKPLTEFHLFPLMPSEIRLKVWKPSMPDARIVELKYSKKIYHAVSPTPAPALLHVCRESREEALKHYSLLYNPHYLTPRIFINVQIDTLYFSEKRGGQFEEIFQEDNNVYVGYFKTMIKNMNLSVLNNLRRIAILNDLYLGNLDWDDEREDVFQLTEFTNLDVASIVLDTGKKIVGPVKLVRVTWGACPIHSELGRSQPYYDVDEVLHSCNLCGCPFIKEVLLELNIDHILLEQLKQGLEGMFTNFKKRLPDWKVPKAKTMILAEKKRDVKKGSFEFHFRKPKLVRRKQPRIPEWANISKGGERFCRMETPRPRSGSF